MIGPLSDYSQVYVAACGQAFASYAQGVDHERNCQACERAEAQDAECDEEE